MSKSLSDLRANPTPVQAERSLTVCLRSDLVAEVQRLSAEMAALPEPERKRARKMSEPLQAEHPRVAEIRAELGVLLEQIEEHEGELAVRAKLSDGEWRRWVDSHPARDEDAPGYSRDVEVTRGVCNADALLEDLGTFVHSWNGEVLADGDWAAVFEPALGQGDKKELAATVVGLYESRLDFPRWRNGLSAALTRYDVSHSPTTSESPRSDSTAGSPDESSEASTETETPAP